MNNLQALKKAKAYATRAERTPDHDQIEKNMLSRMSVMYSELAIAITKVEYGGV